VGVVIAFVALLVVVNVMRILPTSNLLTQSANVLANGVFILALDGVPE